MRDTFVQQISKVKPEASHSGDSNSYNEGQLISNELI